MGRDKALLTYGGGTFLETIVRAVSLAGIEKVAVVLGHNAAGIQAAVDLAGVQVVVNADYRRGQTSSLQAGLRALLAQSKVEAVLLCLVDHPTVLPSTIRLLLERFHGTQVPLVVPTYQGRRGHPILIDHSLFPELLGLPPEAGANAVTRKYRQVAELVEVADRGIVLDVDDPGAYAALDAG